MALLESGENYLETILRLKERNGTVRSIDVANELGFSKPSVSRAVGILKSMGLIEQQSTGNLVLTEQGLERAKDIYDRHIAICRYLNEVLGVSKEVADADACRIEHVISDETFNALKKCVDEINGG